MDTLLLVEDDKFTRHFIKERLEQNDMVVLEAVSGKRSLEILNEYPVDLILLDLGLPDGNGLDFIPDIRKYSNVPLIIISAEQDISYRITGLERGADDFVAKPFAASELVARIKANLRRYRDMLDSEGGTQALAQRDDKIQFAKWTLDYAKFQIFDESGASGDLTTREFLVLSTLVKHAGHVVKRDDLCEAAREESYVPTARAMDVKIARIRKKIGDDAHDPQIIKTVRGMGYLFDHDSLALRASS